MPKYWPWAVTDGFTPRYPDCSPQGTGAEVIVTWLSANRLWFICEKRSNRRENLPAHQLNGLHPASKAKEITGCNSQIDNNTLVFLSESGIHITQLELTQIWFFRSRGRSVSYSGELTLLWNPLGPGFGRMGFIGDQTKVKERVALQLF